MFGRCPAKPPVIVASRSHRTPETDAFIRRYSAGRDRLGRLLAEILHDGDRPRPTSIRASAERWNGIRPPAMLSCAPRAACTFVDGQPLVYGKRNQPDDADFANPWFVATGGDCLPGAMFADMAIRPTFPTEAGANPAFVPGE